MSNFRFLTIEELIKELDKYPFKQLHIHHTWKPEHKDFKGNNHIAMQQSMKNYHVNSNKWSDIGQHLTLFPDGKWLTGRPFNITPASIKGWNTGALAVEMIGNFDVGHDKLEGEQLHQILLLIKYFIDKYGESSIKFHREGPGVTKTCPGTSLDKNKLIKGAKAMSDKKELDNLKIILHGKEIDVAGIYKDKTNYIPVRFLEMLGYSVKGQGTNIVIEYKGEDK
ncbi:N-acetylmuramoyl-L-alanine amidase [Tissierella praeacuta]|uniref:N-acetylmuramoyl-L-alanine amidase n=1 Tax=Tissierella praeacuta TaxID=43131 RepID=UPI003DA1F06E